MIPDRLPTLHRISPQASRTVAGDTLQNGVLAAASLGGTVSGTRPYCNPRAPGGRSGRGWCTRIGGGTHVWLAEPTLGA